MATFVNIVLFYNGISDTLKSKKMSGYNVLKFQNKQNCKKVIKASIRLVCVIKCG